MQSKKDPQIIIGTAFKNLALSYRRHNKGYGFRQGCSITNTLCGISWPCEHEKKRCLPVVIELLCARGVHGSHTGT